MGKKRALTVPLEQAIDELVDVLTGLPGSGHEPTVRLIARALVELVQQNGRVERRDLDPFLADVRRLLHRRVH